MIRIEKKQTPAVLNDPFLAPYYLFLRPVAMIPGNRLSDLAPQRGWMQVLLASTLSVITALLFTSNALGQLRPFPPTAPPVSTPGTNPPAGSSVTLPPVGAASPAVPAPSQAAPPSSSTAPTTTSVAPVGDVASISADSINTALQQIQATTDIDPAVKQQLTTTYEAILAELKNRSENERFYKELLAAYEAAPAATADAKRRKENFVPKFAYRQNSLDLESIEQLQGYQVELQTLLQAATDGRSRVEAITVTRDAQKKELPRLIAETKSTNTKLNEDLNAPPQEGTDPRVRESTLLLIRAKLSAANERTRRFEQELRTYEAEAELLTLQKANYATEEKFYQSKIKEVTEEQSKRQESLILKQKRLAESLVSQSPPELKAKAEEIVKRIDARLDLAKQNSLLRLETDASKAESELWKERFKNIKERLDPATPKAPGDHSKVVTSFNSWVGLMLRRQRSELPDINELNRKLYDYQQKILSTDTLILELDDWKVASTSDAAPDAFKSQDFQQFSMADSREKSRMLQSFEHQIVDSFRIDANNYIDKLINLADTTQSTINQVKQYRDFIGQHVLWIRSSEPFGQKDALEVWPALQWFFRLSNWQEVPRLLFSDLKNRMWIYAIGACLFALLILNLRRFKQEIAVAGQLANRPNCTSLLPTWRTILSCFILASPLAIVHLVVGWRLNNFENHAFADAVGMGLMVGARYFVPLEVLRQVCRGGGLAENHYQWPKETTLLLRKNLRWFIDLGIPCICVLAVLTQFGESKYENSLGRVSYSVLMLLCFVFLLRILHPSLGVFRNFLKQNEGGWIDRLKYVWYPTLSFGPLALLAMSMMGYHYTAVRLAMHLHTTFITLTGILLLSSFIYRWLLLRRRELLVAQAKQRLEEARRRDPNTSSLPNPQLDTRADLASINKQTVSLISSTLIFASIAAVAFIWSSVLPAVGVLDAVPLGWSVEGASSSERIPITLRHLLIAIPTGIMTVVAARNLPGLLEIALLQHLPLENAVRYAISSISRYAILFLGILMTFNSIGIRWASIQWLVAALGVGLGFGLQEIFANFVSGLILLFEQPVRVGDVITLGDTTGTVSRIRMRATTVTNFDQQELIIPNKDLVTGRLLNWTLSDATNRIVIQIGISYDSDPEVACNIIREVCIEHPNVLKEPAPSAFVEKFGENKLELTVRCFLASLDLRLPTRHELQLAFRRRFSELGISIWIPQREVLFKNAPQGWADPAAQNTAATPPVQLPNIERTTPE